MMFAPRIVGGVVASIIVTLSSTTSSVFAGDGALAASAVPPAVSVIDVEVTEIGLELNRNSSAQNDGKVVVKFVLSADLHGTATITWRTVDGSAVAGDHYVAAEGTLSMRPGALSRTVKIPLASNDAVREPDRTFGIEIVSVTGPITVGDGAATVTIRDDDHTPTLTVAGDFEVIEGDSEQEVLFTLTLDRPSEQIVILGVGAFDVTATGGQRYDPDADFVNFHNQKVNTSISVKIDPGFTRKTVFVRIKGDLTPEADETFELRLHHGHRGVLPILPDPSGLVVTILNDD